MHHRETMEIDQQHKDRSQESSEEEVSAFLPRVWVVLIPFTVPVLLVASHWFEVFERTGPLGALFAFPLLSATILAYAALIVALKKRNL